MARPILWVVVPCYNEEKVLPITAPMFLKELHILIRSGRISENSRILFVNDGSKDRTWEIIRDLAREDKYYLGISESRNRGHQNAVLAGLMEAKDKADITISVDADGQDDIRAMEDMADAYLAGNEVVYGVRSKRKTDTFFKRASAEGFYKFLRLMGAEVVYNHADYRLISSKVLRHFAEFEEVNLFLRGMVPLVGFPSASVYYERTERLAGESHYPLRKMAALAFDGITSLSVTPIRMVAASGVIVFLVGILMLILSIIASCTGAAGAGTKWILTVLLLLGGMILTALGIVGQYVGKTYMETKHRPRYIISERTWEDNTRTWIEGKP